MRESEERMVVQQLATEEFTLSILLSWWLQAFMGKLHVSQICLLIKSAFMRHKLQLIFSLQCLALMFQRER